MGAEMGSLNQRIEVVGVPDDRGKPAKVLESTRNVQQPRQSSGGCRGCSHRADDGERAAPAATAAPPAILELHRRLKVLSWMERNVEHLHDAFHEEEDPRFSGAVLSGSVSSFVDVIEEMIFFCDEQRFWAEKHENGVSPCVFAGVIDDLEKKLLFYGKESNFLMSFQ
jgi:hypothetical protein